MKRSNNLNEMETKDDEITECLKAFKLLYGRELNYEEIQSNRTRDMHVSYKTHKCAISKFDTSRRVE